MQQNTDEKIITAALPNCNLGGFWKCITSQHLKNVLALCKHIGVTEHCIQCLYYMSETLQPKCAAFVKRNKPTRWVSVAESCDRYAVALAVLESSLGPGRKFASLSRSLRKCNERPTTRPRDNCSHTH